MEIVSKIRTLNKNQPKIFWLYVLRFFYLQTNIFFKVICFTKDEHNETVKLKFPLWKLSIDPATQKWKFYSLRLLRNFFESK
jgi:hypothetical protein